MTELNPTPTTAPLDPTPTAASVPAPVAAPHALAAAPQYGYPTPPMQVAPKSPGVAMLASFFFPGLGSLMNGNVGKGIGIFIGYFISWILTLVLIGLFGVFGFWVWGMVDAYQGAKRWNAAHGILS